MSDLKDRSIIVTGAAGSIGHATACVLASRGANLMLVDINGEGLVERRGIVAAFGTRVETCTADVSRSADVRGYVEAAVAKHGDINGLFNNAGIIRTAMIHKMSLADWQAVIDVNLSGVFNCLQAVGRHMLERCEAGDGAPRRILNVSSIAGRRGTIGQINYGAAKAGVLGITMSAAREWARFGICVNSVCFGAVETPMTEVVRSEKFRDTMLAGIPMARIAQPDEVATPCCFLLSDGAGYITGQHLSVNGGYHIGI